MLLNASLFVAMAVAMVSGIVISKVIVPNGLPASRYLAWHGLHDGSSLAALVLLGLHVALNWDRIASAGALLPANHRVLIVRPNGRIEASEPPPEITGLLPGSTRPSLSFGGVGFVARLVLLAGVAVIGRKVLRLRLS